MPSTTHLSQRLGRRALTLTASLMIAASGVATASATIIHTDGGIWDYGSGDGTVWSHYFHNGVRHGSTAIGDTTSDSGCVNKNTWSHASAPSKWFRNQSYYRHC